MSKEWGQGTVCFGDDAVFGVNVEYGLEVGEEVRVEFEFYRDQSLAHDSPPCVLHKMAQYAGDRHIR